MGGTNAWGRRWIKGIKKQVLQKFTLSEMEENRGPNFYFVLEKQIREAIGIFPILFLSYSYI